MSPEHERMWHTAMVCASMTLLICLTAVVLAGRL